MSGTARLDTPADLGARELHEVEAALNDVILAYGLVEGVERFYADDVVMQENKDEPVYGRAANVERERSFLDAIERINEIRLLSHAVGDGVTFSEWRFDLTMKSGERVRFDQVAVRRWRDNRVTFERFYMVT
jgi:ketosteroid isomerase-like protein